MTTDRNTTWLRVARWLPLAVLLVGLPSEGLWGAGGAFTLSGHGSAISGVTRISGQPRGDCVHCHDGHGGNAYVLFGQEENACWACHDGSATYAANVLSPVSLSPANTATDYYKHPISSLYSGTTPSTHRWQETSASAFSGSNRHAECSDCHNAHVAQNTGTPGVSTHTATGSATGNRLSPALLGASGIVVSSWQSAGQPFSSASYSLQELTSTTSNYEWQICFKCHSTFTTLPTYTAVGSGDYQATKMTSTDPAQVQEYMDVGQAFNPNNASLHPVTAQGKHTGIPSGSWVSPWTMTSTMYCSDCHNKAQGSAGGVGPHGSSYMHLLERQQTLQASQGTWTRDLCLKCHRAETYVTGTDPITNTNFRDGTNKNLHNQHENNAPCYGCHDTHGTNTAHLLNFDQVVVDQLRGDTRTSYQMWETYPPGSAPDVATGGSCFLSCKKSHDNKIYIR